MRCKATNTRLELGVEAALQPKTIFKRSRQNSKRIETDPVTVAWTPKRIAPGIKNDFLWQYEAVDPLGRILEFSSDNPPVHKATFRVDRDDYPEAMRIAIDVKFRKHGRLPRHTGNLVRDIHAMHITTRLEIKIGIHDNDNYRFPSETKEGVRLHKTIGFGYSEIG